MIIIRFTSEGYYYAGYYDAECLLFPSREMRDWSKFFKRGDVVYIKEANNVTDYAIFDSWKNDDYTEFNASIFYSNKSGFAERKVCTVKLYTKANEILKAKLITFIERHYNGKYNPFRSTLDRAEACRASFKDGVEWFKKALWHDAKEEPKTDKKIIVQHKDFFDCINYEVVMHYAASSWQYNVAENNIIKWCYVDDLLPKGGDK